jgi:hypothetical protein
MEEDYRDAFLLEPGRSLSFTDSFRSFLFCVNLKQHSIYKFFKNARNLYALFECSIVFMSINFVEQHKRQLLSDKSLIISGLALTISKTLVKQRLHGKDTFCQDTC